MKIKDMFKEYLYIKIKKYDEFYINLLINYLKKHHISYEIMDDNFVYGWGFEYFIKIYYNKKQQDKYIYSFKSIQDIINYLTSYDINELIISYDINRTEEECNLYQWNNGLYDYYYNFLNYIGIRNHIEKIDIKGIYIMNVTVYIKEFRLLSERKLKIDKIKNKLL